MSRLPRMAALLAVPVLAALALSACTRTYVERERAPQQPTTIVVPQQTPPSTVMVR
ncbi:hypothetical protein JMJ55_05145 [Belnapia sp. T6]|uniref:Uncharacterized protein n=1 Tax=Belnapia mucosa TaxID=2804532 RepID=A0ABS1UZ85_9PROT|nr:hypothetical protein [Belnapia mucosa]MBL6454700.1 hypothetical protein [Belnapia mucosa]